MVFYGQTGHCRWKVLLENFDEAERLSSCGSCDNCGRIGAALGGRRWRTSRPASDPERCDAPRRWRRPRSRRAMR